jgi:hypothetical protein
MSRFSPAAGTRRLARLGTPNLVKATPAQRAKMGFGAEGPKVVLVSKTQKRFGLRTPFLTGYETRKIRTAEMPKVSSSTPLLDQAAWATSPEGQQAAEERGATVYHRVSDYIKGHREFLGTLTATSGLTFVLDPRSTRRAPVWTHWGRRTPRIVPGDRWDTAYAHWRGSIKFYEDPTINWALFEAVYEAPGHKTSPPLKRTGTRD